MLKSLKLIGEKIYNSTTNRSDKFIKNCLDYEEFILNKIKIIVDKPIKDCKLLINKEFKNKDGIINYKKINEIWHQYEGYRNN